MLAIRALINQGLGYWDIRDQVIEICHQVVNASEPGGRYDILCPGTCDNYGPHVSRWRHIGCLQDSVQAFAT